MADAALDEAALARLREELLRHRTFLRAEMESQGADPDSDDVAFERSQVIAVVRALRSNLSDVERALSKMEAGTYGICERCGRPIAPERLEALPWAVLGIDCKQAEGR